MNMIVMPPEKIKNIQLGGFCSLKSLDENNENETRTKCTFMQ